MKTWLHFASASGREASREKMVLPGAGGAVKRRQGLWLYLLTHDFVELGLQQKRKTAGP